MFIKDSAKDRTRQALRLFTQPFSIVWMVLLPTVSRSGPKRVEGEKMFIKKEIKNATSCFLHDSSRLSYTSRGKGNNEVQRAGISQIDVSGSWGQFTPYSPFRLPHFLGLLATLVSVHCAAPLGMCLSSFIPIELPLNAPVSTDWWG